ncbi:MAG TPA: hypothetical protein PKY56_08450, partial [Candidatus Kapabacteria bacterium]|nr:hypothetical protein [Candidatus Kapabacteria bacterium]
MNEEITLLFAVEAEQLLLSGFVEEAIDLLKKGIEKFPDYSAANAILAKAYTLLGKDDDANQTITNLKETNYFYSKIGFTSESAAILNPDSLAPSIDFNENFEGNPAFQSFKDSSISETEGPNETEEQDEELINSFSNSGENENSEIEDLLKTFDEEEDFTDEKTIVAESIEIEEFPESFDEEVDFTDEKTIVVESIEIEELPESFDEEVDFTDEKTIVVESIEIEELPESFDEVILPKEEDMLEIEDFEIETKEEIESDLNTVLDEIKDSNEFEEEDNFLEIIESDVIAVDLDRNIENELFENQDVEQNQELVKTIENKEEKNNILELSSLIEEISICNDSEINLGFIDSSEKLFNQDCEEFDIDEFIKKNSI